MYGDLLEKIIEGRDNSVLLVQKKLLLPRLYFISQYCLSYFSLSVDNYNLNFRVVLQITKHICARAMQLQCQFSHRLRSVASSTVLNKQPSQRQVVSGALLPFLLTYTVILFCLKTVVRDYLAFSNDHINDSRPILSIMLMNVLNCLYNISFRINRKDCGSLKAASPVQCTAIPLINFLKLCMF